MYYVICGILINNAFSIVFELINILLLPGYLLLFSRRSENEKTVVNMNIYSNV